MRSMISTNKTTVPVLKNIKVPRFVDPSGVIPIRSDEAALVANWFGLDRKSRSRKRKRISTPTVESAIDLDLAPGTITLITGPSGAGKSCLLRRSKTHHSSDRKWIDLMSLRVRNDPIVNCFGNQPLMETLQLLGKVGLGEAWSYLRTPSELSDGQKFRLRLALALHRAKCKSPACGFAEGPESTILACDEFCAVLDRLTAMIVARCLRRTIDQHPHLSGVVATSHDDLIPALQPNVIVHCDFGQISIDRR